jgi:hypothetical protein
LQLVRNGERGVGSALRGYGSFSAQAQLSQIAIGETKRELVEQFAAPYLAARIVGGIWLRNWTIFRQSAIGEKNRAVRLTCRSGQQRRDW